MPKSKKGSNSKQGNSSNHKGKNRDNKKHAVESHTHGKFVFDDGDTECAVGKFKTKRGPGKLTLDLAPAPPVNNTGAMVDNAKKVDSNPCVHVKDGSELASVKDEKSVKDTDRILTTPSTTFRASKGYGRGANISSSQTENTIGMNACGVLALSPCTNFDDAVADLENVASSIDGDTHPTAVICSAAPKFDICCDNLEKIDNMNTKTQPSEVYTVNKIDMDSSVNDTTDVLVSIWNTHHGLIEEIEVIEEEDGNIAPVSTMSDGEVKSSGTEPLLNSSVQGPVMNVATVICSSNGTDNSDGKNIGVEGEMEPPVDGKKIVIQSTDSAINDLPLPKKVGKTFVSLFNDNCKALEKHKLVYTTPPSDEFSISFDEFESVEKTIGFCLVGCVLGRFPGAKAIAEFVKRWTSKTQFQVHSSGWITFSFQNAQDRDRVLHGGPYMILGRQLFLQLLPRCFLYRKEDMRIVPSCADSWATSRHVEQSPTG